MQRVIGALWKQLQPVQLSMVDMMKLNDLNSYKMY